MNVTQTSNVNRKPSSGFKRHTAQNIDEVEELVLSQESAPGTQRTSSDMHWRIRRTQ